MHKRPIKGTASDVGGIVSATRSKKTVNESKIVTPERNGKRKYILQISIILLL